MKKRLLGLLALVLCLMVTGMPVAMADFMITHPNTSAIGIMNGYVIPDGKVELIQGCRESGYHEILYHSPQSEATADDYWRVDQLNGHASIGLQNVGTPVIWDVFENGNYSRTKTLYRVGFEGVGTEFNESGHIIAYVDEIMKAFQDWLNDPNNSGSEPRGNSVAYYSIDMYEIDEGVLQPFGFGLAPIVKETPVTLPIKNAKDVTVLHWNDGNVEQIENVTVMPDGIQFTSTSYSPFMVLYNTTKTDDGVGVPGEVKPQSSNLPKTGDESQLLLWLALMGMSFAGMALLTARRRRHS